MNEINLRTFDVDGTIANKGTITDLVAESFDVIRQQGTITTILTGKGIPTLLSTLGSLSGVILPSDRPFGVESGGRVVSKQSISEGGNLTYHPLSSDDIYTAIDFCDIEPLEFFAYYPEDPRARAIMWTPSTDSAARQKLIEKFGFFADVHTPNDIQIKDLTTRMLADKPAYIAIKPTNLNSSLKNIPRELNSVANEGYINITAQGINKGTALMDIATALGVALENVGFAGNDFNDEQAFTTAGLGEIIVVGKYGDDLKLRTSSRDFIQVNTPGGLAEFIRTFPHGRRIR